MELTIKKRTIARQNKDWVTADQIRQRLGELGVQLEDTPQGTTWHFKS